ncbi:phospho-acceptor domain-containing protein [Roseivirga ehrenbergii]|uniref:histidine kinase n=1 Tax=Roseivirga ehrenbergii (strain DSM 102268 / JCM 13514 / KCTC 12282 / NCIMB 14502 / KMM 6017) TaxID=279360 RepID=A0A150WZ77_ROSEK|nr:sensor histidine kinase [Roseivirga ehrenbergii]KYG71774.1 hypothetical protein MB14_10705 [Roseivirga ehrenbergii]TCL07529.1 phospho-acceptor domain-containing protein [Roseivirga ehrenbergii]
MNKNTYKIGLIIAIVVLVSIAYSSYRTFKAYDNDSSWVVHTARVKATVESLSVHPRDISNNIRNSAINRTPIDSSLVLSKSSQMKKELGLLDSLVIDNAKQTSNMVEMRRLIEQYANFSDSLVKLMSTNGGGFDYNLLRMIANEQTMLDSILNQADVLKHEENRLLDARTQERTQSRTLTPITILLLTLVALAVITFLFIITFNLSDKNTQANKELKSKVNELNEEIEERSYLQELLTNILNSSLNGIMAFESIRNDEGKIIDFQFEVVNEGAANITGVSKEKLINTTLLKEFPGNKESGLFDAYVQVVETGENYHTTNHYEYEDLNTWFDIVAVKNGDGFVVTFTDITQQKNHEQELLLNQQELESTNHNLEQFAYIASHDLQEPLRKIRTFGDRLRGRLSDKLDERGNDYLNRMQNAAERMQTLIDDLLKFSRVSSADREFAAVDLNAILNAVKIDLDYQISKNNTIIESQELPTISGDAIQLNQLFQNLISNAIKYSKPDISPKIEISVESSEECLMEGMPKTDCWKIHFKDNGIGFDPQYKDQIFIIFKRLHGRTEYTGTGIGLALCEKVVTNHGGLLYAESELGKGSIFTIILPKEEL